MGAPDILQHLAAAGVKLTRNGGNLIATPKAAVTPDVLYLIRQHKPELLEALSGEPPNMLAAAPTIAPAERGAVTAGVMSPAAEASRQRVLAMLAERPGIRYAVVVDNPDIDPVLVSVGIRDVATFELAIPAAKFDSFTLIDLIGRYGGVTVH